MENMFRWLGAGGGMCHWPSGSPVPIWLLCCVPCPAHGWEQERTRIWGQPWSAVMPGAYFLLPSLLEVLQSLLWGWGERGMVLLVLIPGCCLQEQPQHREVLVVSSV